MKWLVGILIVAIAILALWYVLSGAVLNLPVTAITVTSAPARAPIIPGAPNETYTDARLSFRIDYPSIASTTSDFSSGYLSLTQTPLIGFMLPRSMFSGTNLVEAGVFIGATTSPPVMSTCTDLSQVIGPVSTSTATIGGQQFIEVDSTGAGVGNLYQEKTFRTIQNGVCLEIVELLHSGNIGNYTPGTVQPFDQPRYEEILNSIVQTYYPIPTGQ